MDYFVGDIHGRDYWKQVKALKKPTDHVFFVGDYFDSKDGIGIQEQLDNFYELADWAQDNESTVHLCFGNHDIQYLCSDKNNGYQEKDARKITAAFMTYTGLIKMYYIHNGYLISHAGICQEFLDSLDLTLGQLNEISLDWFGTAKGMISPVWVRLEDWAEKNLTPVKGFKQIVGHTPIEESYTYYKGQESVEFIDYYGAGFVKHDTKRGWVMRRMWQLIKEDGLSQSDALREAWAEVKEGGVRRPRILVAVPSSPLLSSDASSVIPAHHFSEDRRFLKTAVGRSS